MATTTTTILGKQINALSAETASFLLGTVATATNANNVAVTDTTSGTGPYYLMFADGTTGNIAVRVDSSTLTFNATTNTLTVSSLNGSAASASAVKITDETATAATLYPTFTRNVAHGELSIDSSAFTWNPSTNTLTAANLAGNASTSTTASFAATARTIYNASPAETQTDNYILFNSPNQNAYNTAATDSTLIFNPTSVTLQARNFRSTTSSTVSGSTILSGSTTIIGPITVTGSLRGNVILPTITSNTASLNFAAANFFTCSLANGVTTHISASNYFPGQTVNVLINQGSAGTGKISFPAAFKSGSLYTGSAVANAVDIVTFITFDTTNIYLSAIRNLK